MNIRTSKLSKNYYKYTSGRDSRVTPRNFIAKYRIVGTPNPNEYTTNTAYLTSYSLNI